MELESANSRINLLKIPIDILEEKKIENTIINLLKNNNNNQIIFLGFRDFIRGRNSRDFRNMLQNASLILPSSAILANGIAFLYNKKTITYIRYDFILKLLGILEKYNNSVYIIGSSKKNIKISEKNLKDSYPGLYLVGRSSSHYQKSNENDIILAIKKSSPSLVLTGSGLKGKNKWIFKNKKKFNPGISLWSPDCFEIFSGKKKRPSKKRSIRFFSTLLTSIIHPWRIFYIFPLIGYYVTLLIYKIFKLS